jgi:glucokinase
MKRAERGALGLIADIGGTNIRIALTGLNGARRARVLEPKYFRTADFGSVMEVAQAYLSQVAERPRSAAFALAGVVRNGHVSITNRAWDFSIDEVRELLGLERLLAVNDFEAISWALPELGREDVVDVGGKRAAMLPQHGTVVVLGPGTGLGVSALQINSRGPIVFATEGGHVGLAPGDDEEMQILRCLQQRFGRVSYERVLSGQGLSNLYSILCTLADRESNGTSPEEITRAALDGTDEMSMRAVRLFCELLGGFAGDAALMFGAWDGVYLAGGLVTALIDPLRTGPFRQRFEDKGRFAQVLAAVPTAAIVRSDLGLVGAACALRASFGKPRS